ncbi:MAG: RNA polymerase sigma factor, partial [Planctomycetota bacterium]
MEIPNRQPDILRRMDSVSDEALFDRFRRSLDETAFAGLSDRLTASALSYARSLLGCRHAAEDAVQEAFLRVIRCRDRYDPSRSFRGWFFTILRNACLDEHRRRRREKTSMVRLGEAVECSSEGEDQGEVLRALDRLPDELREPLVLRLWGHLEFCEISQICGCS